MMIVAEITTNHGGNFELLLTMTKLAKEAGATHVKIQKRNPETFYSKEKLDSHYLSPFGDTFRDYRNALELTPEQITKFDEYCKNIGIEWFATVLDEESYDLIVQFNPEYIKIPSTISNHKDFHQYVAKNFKGTLIISTGMTDETYLDYLEQTFPQKKIIVQCNSAYPTPPEECNIAVIREYLKRGHKAGYSSHDEGSLACQLAIGAGATYIEKHINQHPQDWQHFQEVALDVELDFPNFVQDLQEAITRTGTGKKVINTSENHKYMVS